MLPEPLTVFSDPDYQGFQNEHLALSKVHQGIRLKVILYHRFFEQDFLGLRYKYVVVTLSNLEDAAAAKQDAAKHPLKLHFVAGFCLLFRRSRIGDFVG